MVLKKIVKRITIGILLFILPFSLILAVDGGYYYNITSRETIDKLIDDVVNEGFKNQIGPYQSVCNQYIGRNCTSLEETVKAACGLSNKFRENVTQQLVSLCKRLNMTCENLIDAQSKLCNVSSDLCNQVTNAINQVEQAEYVCIQLNETKNNIEKQKNAIYNKPIFHGLSLSGINKKLKNASLIGWIVSVIIVILVFVISRSLFTTAKSVFYTVATIGVVLLIPKFGEGYVDSLLPSSLPVQTINNFINSILVHEFNLGKILLVVGMVGLVATYAINFAWKKR